MIPGDSSTRSEPAAEAWSRRQRERRLSRDELQLMQLQRLNQLLDDVLPQNRFYAEKLAGRRSLQSLDELAELPLTTKSELIGADPAAAWPAHLTYPLEHYVRFHQTSGTSGHPLKVLDTAADWNWWTAAWQHVLDTAEVTAADRCLLAFSFGPFVGFWSAFDAIIRRQVMAIPTGGMSSLARLQLLRSTSATILLCTPSYALHLADVARQHQLDPASLGVRAIIVAGEPGGSIPAVRQQIQSLWQARLIDHAGASEVGPWGIAAADDRGLHVVESEFIAEFVSLETGNPAAEGELAELILTNLGRRGSPVIRYRTGDIVRPRWNHDLETRFVYLEGGVLGRRDDMFIIRGVNIFPSSIESIVREVPGVGEYRLTAYRSGAMDQLKIEAEFAGARPEQLADHLTARLGLRIDVESVPAGTLPRTEFKSHRFVDRRNETAGS